MGTAVIPQNKCNQGSPNQAEWLTFRNGKKMKTHYKSQQQKTTTYHQGRFQDL
jgi:hypothetical protein